MHAWHCYRCSVERTHCAAITRARFMMTKAYPFTVTGGNACDSMCQPRAMTRRSHAAAVHWSGRVARSDMVNLCHAPLCTSLQVKLRQELGRCVRCHRQLTVRPGQERGSLGARCLASKVKGHLYQPSYWKIPSQPHALSVLTWCSYSERQYTT